MKFRATDALYWWLVKLEERTAHWEAVPEGHKGIQIADPIERAAVWREKQISGILTVLKLGVPVTLAANDASFAAEIRQRATPEELALLRYR